MSYWTRLLNFLTGKRTPSIIMPLLHDAPKLSDLPEAKPLPKQTHTKAESRRAVQQLSNLAARMQGKHFGV